MKPTCVKNNIANNTIHGKITIRKHQHNMTVCINESIASGSYKVR